MSLSESAAREPAANPPLFAFDDVGVELGGRTILERVDARVSDSGITAVIGPSGSGKSTLLRLCNRLVAPTSGSVRYRGVDVIDIDPLALRRRVGMVLQRPTPFDGTVADNLRVADPEASEEQMIDLLGRVGLGSELLRRDTGALSGGEAQRMCLARSLAAEPEVLLMDEPTSSLDESATERLERLAGELSAAGTPMLWVGHDLAQARRIAKEFLALRDGQVVATGSFDTIDDAGIRRELFGS